MKYIVLYIIAILWITSSETAAQKPAIDLLPSTHEQVHPEAWIDTSVTKDSLILISPDYQGTSSIVIISYEDSIRKSRRPQKKTGLDSLFKKRSTKMIKEGQWQGINPLIFKNVNPIRFLFHMTALNI